MPTAIQRALGGLPRKSGAAGSTKVIPGIIRGYSWLKVIPRIIEGYPSYIRII